MNDQHAPKGTSSRSKWIGPSDPSAGSEPRPPRHVRIHLSAAMSHLPAQRRRHVRKGPSGTNRHRVMIRRRDPIHLPNVLSLRHNGLILHRSVLNLRRSVPTQRRNALSRRSAQILRRVQNLRHLRVRGHRLNTDASGEREVMRQTLLCEEAVWSIRMN